MSSTVHSVKIKEESPVAPDSTTVDRQYFSVGEDVLHHQEDGLFYFGTIVRIDESNEKGLIQFPDDTSQWSSFRDIKKVKQQEETDISCILCKSIQSVANNQILLCNYCRRGYHQNCHQPPIPKEFADGETHWMCTKCMEMRQLRERDKATLNKRKNGSTLNNNYGKPGNRGRCRSLPYDLSNLRWDSHHLMNKEQKYCYCGANGEWYQMLQCCKCVQWFHQECISVLKQPILLGDRFFLFLCSICSENGEERLMRLKEELTLVDVAHLVLYNLKSETGRTYHDLDLSVVPFLDSKWKQLQPSQEILSMAPNDRRNKMLSCFWQYQNRFMCGREMKKKKTMWGLRVPTPPQFPAVLSPHSLHTLKQWTNSEIVRITSSASDTSSVTALKKTTDRVGKKRTRSSLSAPDPNEEGENRRKLRVRQQRVSSEESMAEESSDDVKLRSKLASRHSKKNGRSEDNSGSNSSVSAVPTPVETSGDETSTRCTLDVFIPPPKNFNGMNNPFASLPSPLSGSRCQSSVLFVRPLKTRLSEKDIRITKNGEIKRKRLIRKIKRLQNGSIGGSNNSSATVRNSCFFHNDSTFSLIDESQDGAFSLSYSDPKGSVLSYFGIEERVSRGEKYSIHAKRVLPKGSVQYLMEWETDRQMPT